MKTNISRIVISMVIAMAVITGTLGFAAATYDDQVILENKDSNWDVILDTTIATVEYDYIGEEFAWHVNVSAAANTDYSLIYYADKPDRFVNWGGDNPGALIVAFTTDGNGVYDNRGYTDINMDLPHQNDANIDEYDYTDEYGTAHGAKLWIVLSDDYTEPALTAWNPASYLFETDLITYTVCGEYPGANTDNATFFIGDVFNYDVSSVPITVLNATNAGAVDITLTYNASVLEFDSVANGEMDSIFHNAGDGQVRIGTYQGSNPGMTGDFTLADVSFNAIGEGTCDFVITVATFKDATPCGASMPYNTSIGICCPNKNGDVNGDGDVDMFDAMYLVKNVLLKTGFDDMCECAADVDGTDGIDINDAAYLARHILGMTGYEVLN